MVKSHLPTDWCLHFLICNKRDVVPYSTKKGPFGLSYIECFTLTLHVVDHTYRLAISIEIWFICIAIWESYLYTVHQKSAEVASPARGCATTRLPYCFGDQVTVDQLVLQRSRLPVI